MGEVIDLPVITKLKVNPDRILQKALDAGMDEVVVCGFNKEGDFYFASSEADAGSVLFHLEIAKKRLLEICCPIEP